MKRYLSGKSGFGRNLPGATCWVVGGTEEGVGGFLRVLHIRGRPEGRAQFSSTLLGVWSLHCGLHASLNEIFPNQGCFPMDQRPTLLCFEKKVVCKNELDQVNCANIWSWTLGRFLEEFFGGQFLMKTFWWKWRGKYSVESCWWKIFGRMGGDQLTGAVELTVGDELTGREPDF